jgi:hypothetical protein
MGKPYSSRKTQTNAVVEMRENYLTLKIHTNATIEIRKYGRQVMLLTLREVPNLAYTGVVRVLGKTQTLHRIILCTDMLITLISCKVSTTLLTVW